MHSSSKDTIFFINVTLWSLRLDKCNFLVIKIQFFYQAQLSEAFLHLLHTKQINNGWEFTVQRQTLAQGKREYA